MYWQHFGLSAEPFSLTPDPAFLYMSEGHAEALAALKLGLLERRGLLAMIGEVGTGKTTLLYSLLAGLEAEIKTAYVSNTRLSFDGILRTILSDFGVTPPSDERVDMLDALNEFLVECAERDTTAALIIDEAQNLSPDAFEEIRLLSNFETYTTKLLQIVLVGQPELATKLNERELRQINERIAVRCYLNPLTESESRSYIEHRLEAAGGSADVFSKRALKTIINWSTGIPRRINILSHNSLLFAYGRSLKSVTPGIVEDAIRDQEGAGLRRFDQPARYEDPGVRDAMAMAVDAAGKRMRGTFGAERSPLVRWSLGGLAVGIAAALLLGSGRGEERADAATAAPSEIAAPASAPAAAPAASAPTAQRPARELRKLARKQARSSAAPAPYTGLAPDVQARLEEALARLEAVARLDADTQVASVAPADTDAPSAEAPAPQNATIATETAGSENAARVAHADAVGAPTPVAVVIGDAVAPAATASQQVADTVAPKRSAPEIIAAATRRPEAANADATPNGIIEGVTGSGNGPQVMIVPAGGTLSDLMVDVYGLYRADLLDAVRAANPHILDPDRIQAGETVIFPQLSSITNGSERTQDVR